MLIKKADLKGNWSFSFFTVTLSLYFLICLPLLKIIFRGNPFIAEYGNTGYFLATILYLLLSRTASLSSLGFPILHIRQNTLIGLLPAGMLVAALPLMDLCITLSGLGETDLLKGALQRETGSSVTFMNAVITLLLIPVVEQFFFSGFIVQSLLKKINPVMAVYLSALIFNLIHLQLNLATFLVGFITAFLFKATGHLLAPILFHTGSALAGTLLLHTYPRLITLFGFLY